MVVQITHTLTPDPSPNPQNTPNTPAASYQAYDWTQFNGDAQHSGTNTLETRLTPGNVAGLQQLFQVNLPGVADGAPVYLHGVQTAQVTKDLLFVTSRDGSIVALDAGTAGNYVSV